MGKIRWGAVTGKKLEFVDRLRFWSQTDDVQLQLWVQYLLLNVAKGSAGTPLILQKFSGQLLGASTISGVGMH